MKIFTELLEIQYIRTLYSFLELVNWYPRRTQIYHSYQGPRDDYTRQCFDQLNTLTSYRLHTANR